MSWTYRTDPSGLTTRWSDEAAAAYRAAGYWRDETLADVARRTRDAEHTLRRTRACLHTQDDLLYPPTAPVII